jgi:hypothetical protein
MMLPERALPKRRRQILDDETQDAHRFNASGQPDTSGHPDTLRRDPLYQDPLYQDPSYQDAWARHFVDRLAVLVRKIGGKNQSKNQSKNQA